MTASKRHHASKGGKVLIDPDTSQAPVHHRASVRPRQLRALASDQRM